MAVNVGGVSLSFTLLMGASGFGALTFSVGSPTAFVLPAMAEEGEVGAAAEPEDEKAVQSRGFQNTPGGVTEGDVSEFMRQYAENGVVRVRRFNHAVEENDGSVRASKGVWTNPRDAKDQRRLYAGCY